MMQLHHPSKCKEMKKEITTPKGNKELSNVKTPLPGKQNENERKNEEGRNPNPKS